MVASSSMRSAVQGCSSSAAVVDCSVSETVEIGGTGRGLGTLDMAMQTVLWLGVGWQEVCGLVVGRQWWSGVLYAAGKAGRVEQARI
jgi:hypothetical protein